MYLNLSFKKNIHFADRLLCLVDPARPIKTRDARPGSCGRVRVFNFSLKHDSCIVVLLISSINPQLEKSLIKAFLYLSE